MGGGRPGPTGSFLGAPSRVGDAGSLPAPRCPPAANRLRLALPVAPGGRRLVGMQTRNLGDVTVSAIGLGGMPLSIEGRPDRERALATIHAALDAGVTLIDTADAYHLTATDVGHNESLIAEALRTWGGDTSDVLVATKGGHLRPGDGSWYVDGSPEHLRKALDGVAPAARRRGDRPLPVPPPGPGGPLRRVGRRARRAPRRGQDPPRGHLQRQPGPDPRGADRARRAPDVGPEPVLAGVPLVAGRARPVRGARPGVPAVEPARRHQQGVRARRHPRRVRAQSRRRTASARSRSRSRGSSRRRLSSSRSRARRARRRSRTPSGPPS